MDSNPAAIDAAIAHDPRALRAALTEGPLPSTIDGKPPVYWVVSLLEDLPADRRPAVIDMLELFLAAGADPNAPGSSASKITPLMEASMLGDMPALRRLIAAGADIHAQTSMGTTALHWAAAAGKISAVRHLIEHGAPINVLNHTHQTPLHLAADRLHRPLIRELYHLGADFNAQDTLNRSALDVIAEKDYRLSEFWRHKPGRDALEKATAPALNTSPRRTSRL